ncbi:MAG: hypothetical protein APF81_20740 [Desulfosporosinus sp. BRH_c37]|nr:MAG: hypothetical protein APF81_20740 [Desulfosporosinus sp. BRH_c37]
MQFKSTRSNIALIALEHAGFNMLKKKIKFIWFIDEKNISLQDFGRALTPFEGFNMDFQIRDLSEEVLGKDTVLRRVSISPDVIIEHFNRSLSWFLPKEPKPPEKDCTCTITAPSLAGAKLMIPSGASNVTLDLSSVDLF